MELIPDDKMYSIHQCDCIEHMHSLPAACIDFTLTSPPFPAVFAYGDSENDIGNSEGYAESKLHFGYFFKTLRRVMKPGRVVMIHCTQIHKSKRDGDRGIDDFRGTLIRIAKRAGFIHEYDWLVRMDPQAQAIRTKKWELKFQGLETDRAISRGAMGDYLLKFLTPGTNDVPITDKPNPNSDFIIQPQVSRNDWIRWAEPCWDDIIQTDTLNVSEGRSEEDTRHICPFALEVVRRLILMYTNPREIVFDPFMGIASVAYSALGGASPKTSKRIHDQRRAYGCELKDEYYAAAIVNCERAIRSFTSQQQQNLFAEATA